MRDAGYDTFWTITTLDCTIGRALFDLQSQQVDRGRGSTAKHQHIFFSVSYNLSVHKLHLSILDCQPLDRLFETYTLS